MFYFVELTDAFIGEANYSWVTRFKVKASSMRGAVWKVSRNTGMIWRKVDDYGNVRRYYSKSGAACFFVEPWDECAHANYSRIVSI